jgi:hypothetical protein
MNAVKKRGTPKSEKFWQSKMYIELPERIFQQEPSVPTTP